MDDETGMALVSAVRRTRLPDSLGYNGNRKCPRSVQFCTHGYPTLSDAMCSTPVGVDRRVSEFGRVGWMPWFRPRSVSTVGCLSLVEQVEDRPGILVRELKIKMCGGFHERVGRVARFQGSQLERISTLMEEGVLPTAGTS